MIFHSESMAPGLKYLRPSVKFVGCCSQGLDDESEIISGSLLVEGGLAGFPFMLIKANPFELGALEAD